MKQNSQWLSQLCTRSKVELPRRIPKRLAGRFVDLHRDRQPVPGNFEVEVGVADQLLLLDHIDRNHAVDRHQLIAADQAGGGRR
jgi:hypothetical protein